MRISEIIKFLGRLKKEIGDENVSCDFVSHDEDALHYSEDLNCIFGD